MASKYQNPNSSHRSKGTHLPIDPNDPLAMMGTAMVGLTLQEMAEREERERRARLSPWQRAAEDHRNKEVADIAWLFVGLLAIAMLAYPAVAIYSTGY